MRLKSKLDLLVKAIAVELCIFGFIALVFWFQYDKAQDGLVTKTKAIAETIGEQAGAFFSSRQDEATSDEFFLFLDKRLGRKKLFNTFEVAPKFFSVVLRKDVDRAGLLNQFKEDFYPQGGYKVIKGGGIISVAVPFRVSSSSEPFGFVKIDSDAFALMSNTLSNNFIFYAAILVMLNNQAFILYLLLRRRKAVEFEKGYLKEHSIGALKIFHRVLGDIIEDHEEEVKTKPRRREAGEKVISLLEMFEQKNK